MPALACKRLCVHVKKAKTRRSLLRTHVRIQKSTVARVFPYEASYFGLIRQPYLCELVSLWQLDLERAESRGPPLDVERTR